MRGINVMDPPVSMVGAVGYGIVDDTTAYLNIINHCFNTGRALIIPAILQSYIIGDLIINGAVKIMGIGKGRPVIRSRASTVNLFTLRSRDIIIETLQNDMDLATNPLSTAFYFDTVNCLVFYEVQIK